MLGGVWGETFWVVWVGLWYDSVDVETHLCSGRMGLNMISWRGGQWGRLVWEEELMRRGVLRIENEGEG